MLNAHPAIGDAARTPVGAVVARARLTDSAVSARLAELNRAYEARFGFRFVVFVNKRPKIRDRHRLRTAPAQHADAQELKTGLREMFAIARDRLQVAAVALLAHAATGR